MVEERLHVYFGDALRRAHHIGGIHSLVGAHHHKFLDIVFHREVGYVFGAEHIGQDSLARVALHHGHMLVGSRVEYIAWTECAECQFHAHRVRHVAYKQMYSGLGECGFHLQLQIMHGCFGLVDEYNLAGAESGYLIHDFAAY